MRQSPLARFLLGASMIYLTASQCPSDARQQPQPLQPSTKPATQLPSSTTSQTNRPPGEPVGPQSTHFPILLLVEGRDHLWSLRIGQKGPERLDRAGYPPIPLDPTDVIREGTTDTWTYNAKDSQTNAAVAVHLTREPCSDSAGTTKYGFSATIDHAQIGSLQGCARVATELFPRINNQPSDDEDDTKEKPTPPTVTHFKPPVAVAYVTDTDRMVVKRGSIARAVPGRAGYGLCLSHDGKKLLFSRDELPFPLKTINEFDFDTRRVTELIRGNSHEAFWSPDDTRIAFLENVNGKWQIWSMAADAPNAAAPLYSGEVESLQGWADAHTVLAGDSQALYWIGDDGVIKQTLPNADLYGPDQFRVANANTVRIHPLTADLLLVSADLLPAAAAAISKEAAAKAAAAKEATNKESANKQVPGKKTESKDATTDSAATQPGPAFFLYEIRAKRRVLLSPPNLSSANAEWSPDGLQIFFTGSDPSAKTTAIYRVFWDGTSLVKVHDGHGYVIGQ